MRPDPNILAFDTAAAHCAAALLSAGCVNARVDEMAKGQAEHLMVMLEDMLAQAGLTWGDLDAIGVGTGPGNFTGIRIAVAAARGLALGLGKPAIGITGFEARAYGQPLPFTATVPAPRNQSYRQTFAQTHISDPIQSDLPVHPQTPTADLIAAVAHLTAERLGQDYPRPAPLYVRSADAAPPKNAAPALIP